MSEDIQLALPITSEVPDEELEIMNASEKHYFGGHWVAYLSAKPDDFGNYEAILFNYQWGEWVYKDIVGSKKRWQSRFLRSIKETHHDLDAFMSHMSNSENGKRMLEYLKENRDIEEI